MADESVSMDKTQPCGKHSLLSSISSSSDCELCSNCSEEIEFDVWNDPFVCVGPDTVPGAIGTLETASFAGRIRFRRGSRWWSQTIATIRQTSSASH
ncbi:MAG: hypothetical protein DWI00_03745 [Planctomycetota bacterium]|nr:MAG: hypothetical protein DWI00_03745 [Planctomycetota bacterium]